MVKRMLKTMMLMLAVCALSSCVKFIPCPDPLPLDVHKRNRSVNGSLRHVMATYAPEEAQVGNKVLVKYENPQDYYQIISFGLSFKRTWEKLALYSAKQSGVFDASSDNDLMLEIEIKELYAPDYIAHLFHTETYYDAHVTAQYTVRSASSGEELLSKEYSATASYDKYDSGTLWQCAVDPNSQEALRRAIAKVNEQFISDMVNVNVAATQQAKPTDGKAQFLAGNSIISAWYGESIANARYSKLRVEEFDRSQALSEFEKMLKLRVIGSGLYPRKGPREHRIFAVITEKAHRNDSWLEEPFTAVTVEYKVVSLAGKQNKKVVYQKSINKRIDKNIGDTSSHVPSVLHCLDMTLDEFMNDMNVLAKEHPGI